MALLIIADFFDEHRGNLLPHDCFIWQIEVEPEPIDTLDVAEDARAIEEFIEAMLNGRHFSLESLVCFEKYSNDLSLERVFVHGGEAWLHVVAFNAS